MRNLHAFIFKKVSTVHEVPLPDEELHLLPLFRLYLGTSKILNCVL